MKDNIFVVFFAQSDNISINWARGGIWYTRTSQKRME